LAPRPSPRRTEVGLYLPLNLRHLKVPPTLTLDLEGSQRHLTPPLLQVIIVASLIPRLLILLGLHDALSYGIELGHLEDCIYVVGIRSPSRVSLHLCQAVFVSKRSIPHVGPISLSVEVAPGSRVMLKPCDTAYMCYTAQAQKRLSKKKKTVRPRQFTAWGTEKALL